MIVDKIYDTLKQDKENDGITYSLLEGNKIDDILDTPQLWGKNPAINDYIPAAKNLTQSIQKIIASAEKSIDLSTLFPFPDKLFLEAIINGLNEVIKKGNFPVVRILIGLDVASYIEHLNKLKLIEDFLDKLRINENMPIYVGMSMPSLLSWNHSKLLIIDGKKLITGGHNYWSDAYTDFAPVHDISIKISGPSVKTAVDFLNKQWEILSRYSRGNDVLKPFWSRLLINNRFYPNALPYIWSPIPDKVGKTKILALGKMGRGLVKITKSNNASFLARIEAIKLSKDHIRFSQQQLENSVIPFTWNIKLLFALGKHVASGKHLSIIIGEFGATDKNKFPYTSSSIESTAGYLSAITSYFLKRIDIPFLEKYLHVAPIRFINKNEYDNPNYWQWDNGKIKIEPANHSKVMIIDNETFYIGSDNAYNINFDEQGLQEFGFMISDKMETDKFMKSFWDKEWFYSSQFKFKLFTEDLIKEYLTKISIIYGEYFDDKSESEIIKILNER